MTTTEVQYPPFYGKYAKFKGGSARRLEIEIDRLFGTIDGQPQSVWDAIEPEIDILESLKPITE